MNYRYVGLRIYNNFNWAAALRVLEYHNYTWSSGCKPTSLYYDWPRGIIFIDVKTKILTRDMKTTAFSNLCNYYIEVK